MGGRGSFSESRNSQKSTLDKAAIQQRLNRMEQYGMYSEELVNLVPVLTNEYGLEDEWRASYATGSRKFEGEVTIPTNSLYSVQDSVFKEDVSNIALTDKGEIKGIAVIEHNGKYIIMDGNHRANAAILRGYKKIKANLYSM